MTKIQAGSLAATLLLSAAAAQASVVTFESRLGNNTSFPSAADYLSNWNTLAGSPATAGYTNGILVGQWDYPVQGNVDNQELVPSGSPNNIAFHYQVNFGLNGGQAGSVDFRIAPDFGFGGAVYLDGLEVDYNPSDMWWGLNWSNSSQLFSFSNSLSAGNHVLDVYGQEGCCDGPTGGQFRLEGAVDWVAFGTNDHLDAIPEPGTLLLIGTGLSGLALRRRRRVS